jgi:hypothetical protein
MDLIFRPNRVEPASLPNEAGSTVPSFQIKLTILGSCQERSPFRKRKNEDRASFSIFCVPNSDMTAAS